MKTAHFTIVKRKNFCVIQLYVFHDQKRVPLNLKLRIENEKQWDKKRQRCRPINGTCIEHNKRLNEISELIQEHESNLWNVDTLRDIVEGPKEIVLSFWDVWEKYLDHGRKTKSSETVTKWTVIRNRLLDFQEHHGELTFERFDAELYDELLGYYNGLEYANNTTGRHIRFIKSFMQWALDRKYHTNDEFKKWKGFSEEADLTYMEEEELFHFMNFPFPKGGPLYNVRENFCFRCFTGMRYSDTRDLHPSEIDVENKRIRKTIYKTGDRNHSFILNKYALDILKRNDLKLHVYQSHKENALLKDAAKEAGLNREIKRMIRRGSKRDIRIEPLHEVISTHMGKRTFITLSLMRGVPERVILKIVGNKDYKSIQPYIKIVDQHSFEWMDKAWG